MGAGHAGTGGLAAAALHRFPGHRFRRTSGVDTHHGYARYSWELVGPGGELAVDGMDVAQVGEDGNLLRAA